MDSHTAAEHRQALIAPLLDDRSIEAIARRVCELLQEPAAPARPRMVSAAEIARLFDVTRQWVYENADRLGAVRLGRGARPRLRFDLQRVEQALIAGEERASPKRQPSPDHPSLIDPADLIPIRRL